MDTSLPNRVLSVVFASDNRGVLQLGIALYSLLESAAENTRYRVYILEDEISGENKEKILSLKESFDTEIIFVPISNILTPFRHVAGHLPAPTYARIFIASLLPDEKLVLYADIDVLFCRDLAEVFETDMTGRVIAAVYEQMSPAKRKHTEQRLATPFNGKYFNAGVLLINLEEMRLQGGQKKMMDYFEIHAGKLASQDQDILNVVFFGETVGLHPRWNWTDGYSRRLLFKPASRDDWGNGTRRQVLEATAEPGILHYWGKYKPWNYNFRYEGGRYRQVWLRSPWKDTPMTGWSFKLCMKKWMMKPIYFLIGRRVARLLAAERRRDGNH